MSKLDPNSPNVNDQIKKVPIKILKVRDIGNVLLDISDFKVNIIEPKYTLLKMGIVYLTGLSNLCGTNLKAHDIVGCTDDPRILEIAQKTFKAQFTKDDIGKIIPPLEEPYSCT